LLAQFGLHDIGVNRRKDDRFRECIIATARGSLMARPNHQPTWKAHVNWHTPVFHVLTAKYDDVKETLNWLRQQNLDKVFLYVGGDGQTMMRINHLLMLHPDLYLHQTPVIIPVQGESPHGVHHFLHAVFRLFQPVIHVAQLIMKDTSVSSDPHCVKEFNRALYLLCKITRAFSEYLLSLRDAPSLDFPKQYIRLAESNIDLAWIVHFLYDGGFLVLDLKKCVRGNDSAGIDILYREFLRLAITGTANKTQYTQMSIMRVFWGRALHPELRKIYEGIRTLPMSDSPGSRVGWDMPCESLHKAISAGVKVRVSQARITNFIEHYPFMQHCQEICEQFLYQNYSPDDAFMKDMSLDVNALVGKLREKVGTTWQHASRPSNVSAIGIPANHGGPLPWEEIRTTMLRTGTDALPVIINRHLNTCLSSFYSFAP